MRPSSVSRRGAKGAAFTTRPTSPGQLGTHHSVSAQHLAAYLNEFVFRFNRCFYPMTAFASALGIGTQVAGPNYDALYGGRWVHPAAPAKL